MSAADTSRIAVVGAGIGGLTLAIALRGHGINVDIYEQTDELREVGAAVALSANATRFFDRCGLLEKIAACSFEVAALIYRDGRTGRIIGRHQMVPEYRQRFGAPFVGIHRADLQTILSAAVGLERIALRKRLVDIHDTAAHAELRFDDGSTAAADLVVGADGARSVVRRWMLGYDDGMYTGCSGFRGVVPMDRLPSLPDPTALQFWIGPGGHLLHYPMGKDHINFLLVERHPTPWPRREWMMPANEGEQLRHFAGWHPAVVEMITAVPVSDRWGLFHRPPLGRWTKGRVTLLGDAAHAMAPHHGQGANQSIEDAVVLAGCLGVSRDPGPEMRDPGSAVRDATNRYEQLRRGRTRKVQYASISTADMLHLPDGDNADRRNARLGSLEGALHHLGWVHEFDASIQEPSERQGGTWL